MKRYIFLTLIFLAMVVAIQLSSCEPASRGNFVSESTPAATVSQATTTPQAAALPVNPIVEQAKPTAAATHLPAQVIPVTAPTQAPTTIDAEVTADALNVRVGPGLNHRIMGRLASGQKVRVEGRSQAGEWLAVRLANGREGWVYSSYVRPSSDLSFLPVMEAYGGPVTSNAETQPAPKPGKRYTLNISISDNQAEVSMAGFAAESDVTLRLTVPGEGLAMTAATTTTDAQGGANLTFDMPTSWPDGSAVTQSQMELQVLGSDGNLLGKAKISYQSGE